MCVYVLHLFSIFLLPGLDSPVGHSFSRSAPSSYPWRETQTHRHARPCPSTPPLFFFIIFAPRNKTRKREREEGERDLGMDRFRIERDPQCRVSGGAHWWLPLLPHHFPLSYFFFPPPLFTRAKYHQSLHQHTHGRVKRLDPAGFPSQRNKKRKHKKRKRRRPNSIGNVWADLSHSVT